jgi:DNA mismatch repair protein MutS
MHVDSRTRSELELFHPRQGGRTVFEHIDRSRSVAGRRKLRQRLSEPISDPNLLQKHFDALRYLAASPADLTLPDGLVEEVEHYLETPWATLSDRGMVAGVVESAWVNLRYPDLLKLARNGLDAVGTLVRALPPRLAPLTDDAVPDALRIPARNIMALSEKLALPALTSGKRVTAALRADSALRKKHRGDLVRFLDQWAELEAHVAAARLLSEGYSLPILDPAEPLGIRAEGVGHPFLDDPVLNPLELSEERNVLFLTGPNMAGKTTYLRSVAVSIYLAHCGMPVPAERFHFTPLEALFTSLGPEDDLQGGVSLFLAEVRRVRDVLRRVAAGGRTLAIFDEAFRGTNVHDAREASRLLILGAAGARSSGFLFASHLSELAPDLEGVEGVAFACFDGEVEGEHATFDHRLRSGVSSRRLGLEILRREGLPALLHRLGSR